jgi:putative sigma-54 modulation protein
MKVEYQARNTELSSRFKEHAEPRIQSLEHHFDRIGDVRVTLSQQRGWKTVEIMLEGDGLLLRAEERSNDELTSFDKALDKLERQLKRYRERVREHTHTPVRKLSAQESAAAETTEPADETEETPSGEIRILRTKTHPLKPMTPEEAALQMELLGHDFFLFFDSQSEQVELVYRRRDGGYGLIEPVLG